MWDLDPHWLFRVGAGLHFPRVEWFPVYRNNYKGHMDNNKGGWKWGREVGRARVGGKGRKLYLNNNKKKEQMKRACLKIKTK